MKYTILFFCFDPERKLTEITKGSLMSIIENSGGRDYDIRIMDHPGFIKEVNRGFNTSTSDYTILYSNDVFLRDPDWLEKMTIPDTVTGVVDTVGPTGEPEVDGPILCIPKNVWNAVGDWDENFKGYGWADQDYYYRVRKAGFSLRGADVKILHLESQTYNAYDLRTQEDMEANKQYFLKKHNL